MATQSAIVSALVGFVVGFAISWLMFGRKRFRAAPVVIESSACVPSELKVRVIGTAVPDSGTTLLRIWAKAYDDPATVASPIPPADAELFPAPTASPWKFDIKVKPPGTSNIGTYDRVIVWSEWQTGTPPTPGHNHNDSNFTSCPTTTTTTTRPPTTTTRRP